MGITANCPIPYALQWLSKYCLWTTELYVPKGNLGELNSEARDCSEAFTVRKLKENLSLIEMVVISMGKPWDDLLFEADS